METSLKTGFAQIFSRCPKNLSCPKFGGAEAPLAPPGPYAYVVSPDKGSKSSEDQIGTEAGRRHATQQLTLCVTTFLASCDFLARALSSLCDPCEKYQITCSLKFPILVVSLVTWSPN